MGLIFLHLAPFFSKEIFLCNSIPEIFLSSLFCNLRYLAHESDICLKGLHNLCNMTPPVLRSNSSMCVRFLLYQQCGNSLTCLNMTSLCTQGDQFKKGLSLMWTQWSSTFAIDSCQLVSTFHHRLTDLFCLIGSKFLQNLTERFHSKMQAARLTVQCSGVYILWAMLCLFFQIRQDNPLIAPGWGNLHCHSSKADCKTGKSKK